MSEVAVVGRACGAYRRPSSLEWGARVIRILHELDMHPEDIRDLLAASDPVVVHRYIELHGERLEERLADQLQTLSSVWRGL